MRCFIELSKFFLFFLQLLSTSAQKSSKPLQLIDHSNLYTTCCVSLRHNILTCTVCLPDTIGFVMSDWRAAHSTSILQGLDQQMPGDTFFGEALIQDVQSGAIPEAAVDQSVVRILTPLFEVSCSGVGVVVAVR